MGQTRGKWRTIIESVSRLIFRQLDLDIAGALANTKLPISRVSRQVCVDTNLALEGFDLSPFFDDGDLGLGKVDGHCEICHHKMSRSSRQATLREVARTRNQMLLRVDI